MIEQSLQLLARGIELIGVASIVLGLLIASVLFLRDIAGTKDNREAIESYRANLGRGILIGLELLVGADIISTITAPLTWKSVGLLGLLIVIRTFLSFSLETEIEGVVPWRRRTQVDGDKQVR